MEKTFEGRLRGLCERIDGAVAAGLVARDGIAVELWGGDEGLDLEALVAEMLDQVRAVADDHREMSLGRVLQLTVTTDRYSIVVGALSPEYYLLLVARETGGLGRARFEVRRALLDFERDLY